MAACIAPGPASEFNHTLTPLACARPRMSSVQSLSNRDRASTTSSPPCLMAIRSSSSSSTSSSTRAGSCSSSSTTGPCHNLKDEGKAWVGRNRHRIGLFRLPPYSPHYNPTEGAWKVTKKRTTHNRFFHTTDERDAALVVTFEDFKADPALLAGHVAR